MKTETEGGTASVHRAERQDPHLFLVVAGSTPLEGGARHVLAGIDEVVIGRGERRSARRTTEDGVRRLVLEVPDPRMSGAHARVIRRDGGFVLEDTRSRNGTRLNGSAIRSVRLSDGDVFDLGRTVFTFRAALTTTLLAPADLDSRDQVALPEGMASLLPEYQASLDTLAKIAARSTSPILLLGDTGTGKEVLARAIHHVSRRGPFVAVNCGALPESLVEGLLFGYTKGAFTGAVKDELGFVRAADGGTLFLDEIGDLPLASQAALLRVLQEREVTPVGATSGAAVDLRVVAATHAPLEDLVEEGTFRADLFSRIAGFVHALPPLNQRREDLGAIMASLVARLDAKDLTIGAEAARILVTHGWPRNVRELEHALSVASVLAVDVGTIESTHLPKTIQTPAPNPADLPDDEIRRLLVDALTAHRGNITQVARAMGKARVQIQRWVKRFALDPEAYR